MEAMKSSGLSDGVRRRHRILAVPFNSFTLVQIEKIVDESIGMALQRDYTVSARLLGNPSD